MSEVSATLSLPYLQPAQAQKHVTHNEALRQLDTLVQLTLAGTDATEPPAAPVAGDTHALGQGATGAWSGQDGTLASFDGTGWTFATPGIGWLAWDRATDTLRIWTGTTWTAQEPPTQNLDGIGIGTASDTTNRLAVASDATLLTHAVDSHRLKVNKATAGDTASLLFQTGWSGRAEMGLSGSDDFAVKVSEDGTIWHTGLSVKADTGFVGIGTQTPDTALHTVGLASEIRAETTTWNTAILTAKGQRSGNGAAIGKLCFINQESVSGSNSAEASLEARRRGQDGIELTVKVCNGGVPTEAFTIEKTGHLDQLRFAPRTAPTQPDAGQVYFDAAAAKLRCYDGIAWRDLH